MKIYFCSTLSRLLVIVSATFALAACGGVAEDPLSSTNITGDLPEGTLTFADAPASIGAKFTSSSGSTVVNSGDVTWVGAPPAGGLINLTVAFNESTGKLTSITLLDSNTAGTILDTGGCSIVSTIQPCDGVALDTNAGKVSFTNTKLRLLLVSNPQIISLVTVNGTLAYTPKTTTTSTTNTSTSPTKVTANGSLTVTNASAEFGTLFAASTAEVTLKDSKVVFKDSATDFTKQKVFIVGKATSPNQPIIANLTGSGQTWLCSQPPTCTGITIDMAAGTVTFANTTLPAYAGIGKSVTVNGTLTFTPVTK